VVSIPKSGDAAHVRENAAAAAIRLTKTDLAEIDAAFPPPKRKQSLGML
jgi:diketogulonate reductase-like aldo/keto reductase